MKISIEEVESTLLSHKSLPKAEILKVIEELKLAAEEEKKSNSGDKAPKSKNTFYIVAINDDAAQQKIIKESSLYIVQIKEGEDFGYILEKLQKSGGEFNDNSRSGRKNPLTTFAAIFSDCKSKFFKNNNIKVKTKEPVVVITTNNKIV